MNLHRSSFRALLTAACTLSLGVSAHAFADVADAGSTGSADDATATSDAGSAPDTATGDTGAPAGKLNTDPCWATKCPTEAAACAADPDCLFAADCIEGVNTDTNCQNSMTQTGYDKYNAFSKCGYAKCADPNAGTCKGKCGNFIKADACHCDDACGDYGDCCTDHATLCGFGTCAAADCSDGSTGKYIDGTDAQCECGSSCESAQSCCPDYATTCQGKTPTCTPACTQKDGTAKQCGPDNCGGTCGTCAAGSKCVSGACTGGTTGGADAGGTDSAAAGDAISADTGTTGGTATDSGSTAKSSGCTAGTTTGNSAGLLGMLLMAGAFVAMRRRA